MTTRLIDRIFSAIDNGEDEILNQIRKDYDDAIKNGENDTVQLKYVKLPDQTVEVTDKDNGEHTVIKKSGSCMMMKSGNSHMFSLPYNYSDLFSPYNNDDFDTYTTRAFAFLFNNLPTSNDVRSTDEINQARNDQKKLKETVVKWNDSLNKKKQKLNSGKEITETEEARLRADIDVLKSRIKLAELNIDGSKAQINGDRDRFLDDLAKASKARAEYEKFKEIAERKKIDNEEERLEKQTSSRDNLGGKTEDKMKKNLNNAFVNKSRISRFSKAGYSDEREKVISLLLDLLEAKTSKDKSKVISGLESVSKKITDNKVKNIILSMIDELDKLNIKDPQYDQIVSDTIDNMKNEGIVRLFSDTALESITRFYAYGDMTDNPNYQAHQQYVADRRRQGFKNLRNAALIAGGGALAYNYFNNNGIQPLMNTIHRGANAVSRAANNVDGQWTAPQAATTTAQPATAMAEPVAEAPKYDSQGNILIQNGQDLDAAVMRYQNQMGFGPGDHTHDITNGQDLDAAVERYKNQMGITNNVAQPAVTATETSEPGFFDNVGSVYRNVKGTITNGVNKVSNFFKGENQANKAPQQPQGNTQATDTTNTVNDPHQSAYLNQNNNPQLIDETNYDQATAGNDDWADDAVSSIG